MRQFDEQLWRNNVKRDLLACLMC